jgi:hypothetical protein
MIDITGIKIREVFIHCVGNQLRNEGVAYSDVAQKFAPQDELPLIQFLFGHSDRLNSYAFTHSVDTGLNAVRSLASAISSEIGSFKRVSSDIAAHLYSVSNHPRVRAGNLFVGIFDGIRIAGNSSAALGIFKSDTVSDFIKVNVKDGKASFKVDQGAAVTSLDKVGLVFLSRQTKPETVLSACARGEDAVFWNERFLQLTPVHSAKADTKACLDMCRAFAMRGGGPSEDPERLLFLNRSLQFFETSEKYDDAEFSSVFTSKTQEDNFVVYKTEREVDGKASVPGHFIIDKTVVRKERTKFEKNVRLDAHIEIRLRFQNHQEMKKRVEQGFDREKGMSFYKLYYSTVT